MYSEPKVSSFYVIGIDPSGNFHEGKGTTGIVWGDSNHNVLGVTNVCAKDYDSDMAYFHAVIHEIEVIYFGLRVTDRTPVHIVIEDYRLYNHRGNRAESQSNSLLETPRLIGVIEFLAYTRQIPVTKHMASDVKNRWSDLVLEANHFLKPTGRRKEIPILTEGVISYQPSLVHERDALRHYHHFVKYTSKKEK